MGYEYRDAINAFESKHPGFEADIMHYNSQSLLVLSVKSESGYQLSRSYSDEKVSRIFSKGNGLDSKMLLKHLEELLGKLEMVDYLEDLPAKLAGDPE